MSPVRKGRKDGLESPSRRSFEKNKSCIGSTSNKKDKKSSILIKKHILPRSIRTQSCSVLIRFGMEKSGVEILGSWASPYSNRVQIAFNLKSIDYEFSEVNFYSNKSERLLQSNPVHKKIPVLIHDGKPICESSVILQYIDEVWADKGPSILPSDPYDRVEARFWAAYIDEQWFPLFKELGKASRDEARGEIVGKIFGGLMLLEEAFVKSSKGGDFFGGDAIGYIDIVLGSCLGWIKLSSESAGGLNFFDETRTPGLGRWAERFVAHDTAKDVVPQTSKLMEFFMMVVAARAASGLKSF